MIDMQEYIEHPTEDTLERFVLHQLQDDELEGTESHILACNNCITRLEAIEVNVAATRIALAELHQHKVAENVAKEKTTSWGWLRIPSFAMAGVAAAFALTITIMPSFSTVEADIRDDRGSESVQVPVNHPLFLHLNAKNLPAESVALEVVDADGVQIWKSIGVIDHLKVDAHVPKIKEKGSYLLRLFSTTANNGQGNLLREFSFQVQ